MFDPKQAYWYTLMQSKPVNPPTKNVQLTHTQLYKFTCANKVVYHIVVEIYKDIYYFIKYYPSKMQHEPMKYKVRTNRQKDFSKIIGTCAKLTSDLINKRPDAFFGFVGQWDEIDIDNKEEISQRFTLYRKISANLFPKEKYTYVEVKHLNMMVFSYHENVTDKVIKDLKKDVAAFLTMPGATSLIMPTHLET